METADYKVELRIDGILIGDVRRLAQNLTWVRRRTKTGVDEIDFTINDVLFSEWCIERGTDLNSVLKPFALDCRIIRNGIPVVGGFLATMPAYNPRGTSADLVMRFDGYLNLLAGVYMYPVGTQIDKMGTLVDNWIKLADSRASEAGKAFGFTTGSISDMATVQYTFDNYKPIKEAITDRSDNIEGAGPFDIYFHPDRTYDIISDDEFGDDVTSYIINYPTRLNGISATSISAQEVQGFASSIIGLGAGEVSSNPDENTVIVSQLTNEAAVKEYGYCESLIQNSSVSRQTTLDSNVATELDNTSNPIWQPETVLIGRQIAPSPVGEPKIWIGDKISLYNSADLTGQTSGIFRVNELSVAVSATGAETITPVWERVE